MGKNDLQQADIEDFFYWINERHKIYTKRFLNKKPKPWTEDKILQQYKFTNVYRQLDKGTIALDSMLGKWFNNPTPLKDMDLDDAIDIAFNIIWYRMFNWYEHAKTIGFVSHKKHAHVLETLTALKRENKRIYTGAYMISAAGRLNSLMGKVYATFIAAEEVAEMGEKFISFVYYNQTLEAIWEYLKELPMVGEFVAYEIVSDFRHTPLLSGASDKLTWANIGPGAVRGLKRLSLAVAQSSMQHLLSISPEYLEPHVNIPFEMREIEHSLCEFDKYMRIKSGHGKYREGYNGVAV